MKSLLIFYWQQTLKFDYSSFKIFKIFLRVCENMVLMRIFGPKRDEVIKELRNLRNEELYDLYSLSNIVLVIKKRSMSWAGQVERTGKRRGAYRVLLGKPEGKRQLGRPKYRQEVNIKMSLQDVGWGVWTGSIRLRIGTGGGHLWMR